MLRRTFIQQSSLVSLGFGLGAMACGSAHQKDTEVLILGAGLSGLHAGMLLKKKGIDFQVLEGSQRVGGRLYTRNDFSSPTELGGVEIGDGYQRVVQTAKDLDVQLISPAPYPRKWCIHYQGQNILSDQWANAAINPLEESLKSLAPYRLESAPLRGKLPFKSIDDWYEASHQSLDHPYAEFLKQAGYSDQAIQLANISANHNGIDKVSTIQIMRSLAYRMMGGSKAVVNIEGGSSRLPEAMAKHLGAMVFTNKRVVKIDEDQHRVAVHCADGSIHRANKLICTLPFSVLRHLKINASFSAGQKKAIETLPYTQISIGVLAAKEKFWQDDKLPISMWTDTPIERVFAANSAESDEVLLKVFINGEGAKKVDQLDKAAFHRLILDTFHKIRPASKDKLEVLDSFSWGNYAFSRGAYAEFHAGQVASFVPEMARPTTRIFLAGEHTSFDHRGMEGAMASAERAVNELFDS